MKSGDRVRVVAHKNPRLEGRVGTVLNERTAYPRHVKVKIPGVPRQPFTSDIWFLTHDEIEDETT